MLSENEIKHLQNSDKENSISDEFKPVEIFFLIYLNSH